MIPLHLDVSAIEAEAFRLAASQIESFDKLIASARSQLRKDLRGISEYRSGFARQLSDAAHPIIEGRALTIENSSSKRTGTN